MRGEVACDFSLTTDDLSSRKLLTDNSENIGTEKMLATDFNSLNLDSGF